MRRQLSILWIVFALAAFGLGCPQEKKTEDSESAEPMPAKQAPDRKMQPATEPDEDRVIYGIQAGEEGDEDAPSGGDKQEEPPGSDHSEGGLGLDGSQKGDDKGGKPETGDDVEAHEIPITVD